MNVNLQQDGGPVRGSVALVNACTGGCGTMLTLRYTRCAKCTARLALFWRLLREDLAYTRAGEVAGHG